MDTDGARRKGVIFQRQGPLDSLCQQVQQLRSLPDAGDNGKIKVLALTMLQASVLGKRRSKQTLFLVEKQSRVIIMVGSG